MSAFSLMQFVFGPILGRLSDRIGRRPGSTFEHGGYGYFLRHICSRFGPEWKIRAGSYFAVAGVRWNLRCEHNGGPGIYRRYHAACGSVAKNGTDRDGFWAGIHRRSGFGSGCASLVR